jgi:hypothetical protein
VYAVYDPATYVAFSSNSYEITGNVFTDYTVIDAISSGGMFQELSAGNETLNVKI